MPKTNAERQAAYRQRRIAGRENEYRLNLYLAGSQWLALERLAHHRGLTKKAMLAQLIQAEEDRVLEGVEADSAPWNAYWDKTPLPTAP